MRIVNCLNSLMKPGTKEEVPQFVFVVGSEKHIMNTSRFQWKYLMIVEK